MASNTNVKSLEEALQAGQVVSLDRGRYKCAVCDKTLASKTTIRNHLTTKTHLTKLTKVAPTQTASKDHKHETQFDLAPEASSTNVKSLEEALQAGQVVSLDRGRYKCAVCDKTLASKTTIRNHLTTKTHLTKVASTQAAPRATERKILHDWAPQAVGGSYTNWDGAVQAGHVKPLTSGRYRCEVCDREYASKATARNHLNTNKHITNVYCRLSSVPSTSASSGSGVRRKKSEPLSEESDEDDESETSSGSSDQGDEDDESEASSDASDQLQNPGKIEAKKKPRTKKDGKQVPSSDKDRDVPPEVEDLPTQRTTHLQNPGKIEAKKKPRTKKDGNQVPSSDKDRDVPPEDEDLPTQRTTHKPDAEILTILLRNRPEKPIEDEYHINTKFSPGRVDVFNYICFHRNTRQSVDNRKGAQLDSVNIKNSFTRLGYKVYLHEDLSKSETFKKLEKIKKSCSQEPPQAFFAFFLSHGSNSKEFMTADGLYLDIDDVRSEFTNDKCPALVNKPKIFMTNYCRGKNEERLETDGKVQILQDIVTISASKDGIAAYRQPEEGTSFVVSLCKVMNGLRERTELRTLYRLLQVEMKRIKATTPVWEDVAFTKQFYLEIPEGK